MSASSFKTLPKSALALRMAPLILVGAAFGLLLLGEVLREPEVRAQLPKLEAFQHVRGNSFSVAIDHARSVGLGWSQMPEPCRTGKTLSDFQAEQCREMQTGLAVAAALLLVPLVMAFLVWVLAFDSLAGFYRRAARKIESGNAAFQGTVTEPARLPSDRFAWFHCLRCVSVEIKAGQQAKVYLAAADSFPKPGEKVAAFDCGSHFGEKRFVIVPYRPHVVVVKGVDR